jgi:hypothetical protein
MFAYLRPCSGLTSGGVSSPAWRQQHSHMEDMVRPCQRLSRTTTVHEVSERIITEYSRLGSCAGSSFHAIQSVIVPRSREILQRAIRKLIYKSLLSRFLSGIVAAVLPEVLVLKVSCLPIRRLGACKAFFEQRSN